MFGGGAELEATPRQETRPVMAESRCSKRTTAHHKFVRASLDVATKSTFLIQRLIPKVMLERAAIPIIFQDLRSG